MSQKKQKRNKLLSIMTNCAICNTKITKKNYRDGIYLCDKCNTLGDIDISIKLFDKVIEMQDNNKDLDQIIDEIYKLYKGEKNNR